MMPELFVPIESMGPKYSEVDLNDAVVSKEDNHALEAIISDADGILACEVKEDGFRCQPHVDNNSIKLFTRGLGEFELRCFPDIAEALKSLKLKGTILDAELVGFSGGFDGYKEIQSRARYAGRISEKGIEKYLKKDKVVDEFPLELVVFDVLMLNGKSCLDVPYWNRRMIVEDISSADTYSVVRCSEKHNACIPKDVIKLYRQKVQGDLREGLVLKQQGVNYIPGDKNHWIKLKKFETIDLVVVGLCKRENETNQNVKFGQAIVASYNSEKNKYQSVGAVNLVRENPASSRTFAEDVYSSVKKSVIYSPPLNINFGNKKPDIFMPFDKSIVLEIRVMNFEFGFGNDYACSVDGKGKYSLRIAYVKNIRDDKRPEQATTSQQIAQMCKMQK